MPGLEPVGLDFVDRADVVVTTEVDVPASRTELWDALVDNSTWPDWFEDCRRCEASPPIWREAGDTRRIHVGPLRIDEEAVAIEEHARWAITVTATNLLLARRMLDDQFIFAGAAT